MKKYTSFLEITTDSMILSMKKRSYEKYESNDSHSTSNVEDSSLGLEGEDSQEIISEDDEDVYKNIDITNEVYIQEFKNLRGTYWEVKRNVKRVYDFGLIQMDCSIFLKHIVKHLDKLISHLTLYIRNDFLARTNHTFLQYQSIEQRVSSQEENPIDEVIYLIEFIDNIKKPDQKLEELQGKLEFAKRRKEFIDDLYIPLSESDFLKYLSLLKYPKNLLEFLDKRRNELENERTRLSKMMEEDIKEINKNIIELKKDLDQFKEVGMNFVDKKALEELNKQIVEGTLGFSRISRENASKQVSKMNSFQNESKKSISDIKDNVEHHGDFDSTHIENYSERIMKLKELIAGCQQK